jgi:ParB-like nuclease domain
MQATCDPDRQKPSRLLIDVQQLKAGESIRLGDLNKAHLETIISLAGSWPPLLVHGVENTIIDGHYRYQAAIALGLTEIECEIFEGKPDDAYIEAIRRNVARGLPLSLVEREQAATQILQMRIDWSDRQIAYLCALSPRTVARIRSTRDSLRSVTQMYCSTDENARSNTRIGRDGKRRPVDSHLNRDKIAEALVKNPDASLRYVARLTGTSPSTVRSVREKALLIAQNDGDFSPSHGGESDQPADNAVQSTTVGRQLAKWFSAVAIGEEWHEHVCAVPLSRIYEFADEARIRSKRWQDFASALEARTHGGWSPSTGLECDG